MEVFGVSTLFRDVRPDAAGFQPTFLYVLVCLLGPVVLGVLSAGVIAVVEKLVGRARGEAKNDA